MEPSVKFNSTRNFIVRVLLFGLVAVLLRFSYVVTMRSESCNNGDFCFFPESVIIVNNVIDSAKAFVRAEEMSTVPDSTIRDRWSSYEWRRTVDYFASVFQSLMAEGFLSETSRSLCIDTTDGQDVLALREIGISDSIGVSKKPSPPLVRRGNSSRQPFGDQSFDFIFAGWGAIDHAAKIEEFAGEIMRILRPEGILVVHTTSAKDLYSFNSLLTVFSSFKLIRSFEIDGVDSFIPPIHEFVLKKETQIQILHRLEQFGRNSSNKCNVPLHKRQMVDNVEPLITEEPLKPWITLKRNLKNIKYIPSIADISFKSRYVYIDVGARSYGSSIGSWFKKQYPKQNKTFEIYAIEADSAFHGEYSKRKGVNLLPYAAWVRNETLFFEINRDPVMTHEEKVGGRGMGRIRPAGGVISAMQVDKIKGFDFAAWLMSTVSENDFVVVKMDVEGTEFDLIPRLFETGAICLIDELFLECHYNRWQKCCPGERSPKYQKTYGQCLELFSSLRDGGILVHQWW